MKHFIPFAVALMIAGCTSMDPSPQQTSTIHMTGFIVTSDGSPVASYWKDGAYNSIVKDSVYSNVKVLFVDDSGPMISGYDMAPSSQSEVFLWRNGTRSVMEDAWGDGAFLVSDNTNLFTVWQSKASTKWMTGKNGDAQPLIDTASQYWPTALAIDGNEMYISGVAQGSEFTPDTVVYYSDQSAQCWKNSQLIFREARRSYAWSVFFHQGNIYIGGNLYQYPDADLIACYWKNGVRTELTDGSQDAVAYSVVVTDAHVYVSGTISGQACYWKDGNVTLLPHDSAVRSGGNSIFVNGDDVYVAGYDGEHPAYWMNAQKQSFDYDYKRGELKFIVVKN